MYNFIPFGRYYSHPEQVEINSNVLPDGVYGWSTFSNTVRLVLLKDITDEKMRKSLLTRLQKLPCRNTKEASVHNFMCLTCDDHAQIFSIFGGHTLLQGKTWQLSKTRVLTTYHSASYKERGSRFSIPLHIQLNQALSDARFAADTSMLCADISVNEKDVLMEFVGSFPSSMELLIIPEGVTKLGYFATPPAIKTLVLPSSLRELKLRMLSSWNSLEEVIFQGNDLLPLSVDLLGGRNGVFDLLQLIDLSARPLTSLAEEYHYGEPRESKCVLKLHPLTTISQGIREHFLVEQPSYARSVEVNLH